MSSTDAPGPASGGADAPAAAVGAAAVVNDTPDTPANQQPRRWRTIRDWTRKDRLEVAAYLAAMVLFLYKCDSGAFSTALSVLPTCRVVGTAERPQIAATVEFKGDDALKGTVIALDAPIFALPSDRKVGVCRFHRLDQELDYNGRGFVENPGYVAALTPGESASFDCVSSPLLTPSTTPMLYTVDVRVAVQRGGFLGKIRDHKERRGTCVVSVDASALGSRP